MGVSTTRGEVSQSRSRDPLGPTEKRSSAVKNSVLLFKSPSPSCAIAGCDDLAQRATAIAVAVALGKLLGHVFPTDVSTNVQLI